MSEGPSRRQFLSSLFRQARDAAPSENSGEPPAPNARGVANISIQHCLAHIGSFCSTCVERCPEPGAITVEAGKPTVVAERCSGCGDCVELCPAPVPAISRVTYEPPARFVGAAGLPTDRITESDLPELREGFLDRQLLSAWFQDLDRHTERLHLQGRPPRGEPGPQQSLTPESAQQALVDGKLRAVQARYQYQGLMWMDTVLPEAAVSAAGAVVSDQSPRTRFRLIRVQPDLLPE